MLVTDAALGEPSEGEVGPLMVDVIRTRRLELIPISDAFVAALLAGDLVAAQHEIGAGVSPWLLRRTDHVAQLRLAQSRPGAVTIAGAARAIVLTEAPGRRRVIGSIGLHGPADASGSLEVGCRIDPAFRRRGLAAEALTAICDWAADELGVSRFLVSIVTREPSLQACGVPNDGTRLPSVGSRP